MPYDPTIPEEEQKNRVATKALAAKIAPRVREYGFLR